LVRKFYCPLQQRQRQQGREGKKDGEERKGKEKTLRLSVKI